MAGGDPTDLIRSMRRYVSLMLGSPPWTARVGRVRASDDERPVVIVDPASPTTTLFSRAGGLSQGDVQLGRTLSVVAYPELGATAQEATIAAEEIAELLQAGFERGLVTGDVPPVNIGGPWRVPVYDYAGVPVTGQNRGGPAEPYMHANVTVAGFNVRAVQDAMDELRYTVVAAVPLAWWRGGRIPSVGPIATGVTGTYQVGQRPG